MFIIVLRYIVTLEKLDEFYQEHLKFLDDNYTQGNFIASGPQQPRSGGIIIAQAPNRRTLKGILALDPFFRENLAEYQIFEFNPTKYNEQFLACIRLINQKLVDGVKFEKDQNASS